MAFTNIPSREYIKVAIFLYYFEKTTNIAVKEKLLTSHVLQACMDALFLKAGSEMCTRLCAP